MPFRMAMRCCPACGYQPAWWHQQRVPLSPCRTLRTEASLHSKPLCFPITRSGYHQTSSTLVRPAQSLSPRCLGKPPRINVVTPSCCPEGRPVQQTLAQCLLLPALGNAKRPQGDHCPRSHPWSEGVQPRPTAGSARRWVWCAGRSTGVHLGTP